MLIAIDPGPERSGYVDILSAAFVHAEWLDNDVLADRLSFSDISERPLVQEGFLSYGLPIGKTTMKSLWWAGVFAQAWGRDRSHELNQSEIRQTLFADSGLRRQDQPKNLYPTILELYGGKEKAVGGARCKTCGGKGRRGRAMRQPPTVLESMCTVEHEGKRYQRCGACSCHGHADRGPLYKVHKVSGKDGAAHVRSALAVGVAYMLRNGTAREEFSE